MNSAHSNCQILKRPEVLEAFSREVRMIHVTWLAWNQLFHANRDLSVLQNWDETWKHIQWSMLSSVVLALGRLVDPDQMSGRDNLTVDRVWREMDFSGDEKLERAAEAALRAFRKEVNKSTLVQMRHRVLGHNDLANQLGSEVSLGVPIDSIERAVEKLVTFQWRCDSLYERRSVQYETPASGVNRDRSLDRAIASEVNNLLQQLRK